MTRPESFMPLKGADSVAWCICGAAYPARLKSCPECELDQQTTFLTLAEQERRAKAATPTGICEGCGKAADFGVCDTCLAPEVR